MKNANVVGPRGRAAILGLLTLLGWGALPALGMLVAPPEAHAVIGRPFTPVSYAGVARRSSRRVARRTVARGAAYYGAATLPAGCVANGAYYTCGSTQYQEVYDGGGVTYIEVH